MDTDMPSLITPVAPAAASPTAPPPPLRPRSGRLGAALALLAIAASAVALWQVWSLDRGNSASDHELALQRTDIDGLRRAGEQERREREALRQRLADSENVNKSLREEVLGFSERARVLEDAITNLAARRVSGHDALLLDEAELILLLAQERYELSGDSAAALRASRLADSVLVGVEDPAFTTLREMLGVEIRSLSELRQAAPAAAIGELETLRAQLASLPLATRQASGERGQDSRLWRVLGQFVRISRGSDAAPGLADTDYARGLVALDLRAAELALAGHDPGSARAAMQRAGSAIANHYERSNPQVHDALQQLEQLTAATQATAPVQLGAALKELRRLRNAAPVGAAAAAPTGSAP